METKKLSGNSLLVDGAIGFVAGVVLLFLTDISLNFMVFLFGIYAIILGATQILAANGETDDGQGMGYLAILGFFSLFAGVGLLFFMNSDLTMVLTLIGAYIVAMGLAETAGALLYRSHMNGYIWLITSGIIRTGFGLFLLFNTTINLSAFILWIAIYAIVEGIVMGLFGYEIREGFGKYDKPLLR